MSRQRKPLEWLGGTGAERCLYRGARVLAIVFPYYHGNRINRWGWHTVPQRKHSDRSVESLDQAMRECQTWVEEHESELGPKTPRNAKVETYLVYAVCDLEGDKPRVVCNRATVRGENARLKERRSAWDQRVACPAKDLHRTPEAAIRAWRESLLSQAEYHESSAARLREDSHKTPKMDCENWR